MTPAQIVSAVRDLAILAALGFVLWYVHRADENAAAVRDLKSDTKQLVQNQQTTDRWHQEQTDANTKSNDAMAALARAVSNQPPVIVRVPASKAPDVPAHPGEAARPAPDEGGVPAGHGAAGQEVDRRPDIAAYELKYGAALIQGQKCYDSWPH